MTSPLQDLSLSSMYGAQNEAMIHGLASAYSAVLELVARGFTVENVSIIKGKLTVIIQHTEECQNLKVINSRKVWHHVSNTYMQRDISVIKTVEVVWFRRVFNA